MRAVRYHQHGGPEVLRIDELPEPEPGPGQVVIGVEAVGANVIDAVVRAGSSPWPWPLPAALTGDAVGRVTALGAGVTGVAVGDRVAGLSEAAVAERAVVDARWLAPVPDDADAGSATALAMAAPLALRLLRAGRLAAGETVLVQSAAGGVGHLAVQLAVELAAGRVIGTASTPDKREFVLAQGAHAAIDYTDPAWPESVHAAAPDGVHLVLDAVGGAVFDAGVELLAPLGRMVTYGAVGGQLPTVAAAGLFALKEVLGVSMRAWQAARPAAARADMLDVAELWRAGRLRQHVHATFPMSDIAAAHEVLDGRRNAGRVVVTP